MTIGRRDKSNVLPNVCEVGMVGFTPNAQGMDVICDVMG